MINVIYPVRQAYDIEEIQYYVYRGKKNMEKYNNVPISERYEGWHGTTNDMTLVDAVAEVICDSMDELRYYISDEDFLRVAQNFIDIVKTKE